MLLLVPFLALVALAAVEIYVIVVIAHVIGVAWTIAALIASTMAGLALVRSQRRRAWSAVREAVASGAVPDRELGDAALIFTGGVLFAIPGFVTDALGLLAVAPLTRPAMRRLLGALLLPRAVGLGLHAGRMTGRSGTGTPSQGQPAPSGTGKVIRGHVIDGGTAPGK
ncbi:MAG: FxsA family protein [Micromonosporaceae bacterium]